EVQEAIGRFLRTLNAPTGVSGSEPVWLLNALSLNMVSHPEGAFRWRALSLEGVRAVLSRGFASAIGHEDLARLLTGLLGVPVPANRVTVSLGPGSRVVVAQYKGPRLPEGATALPEGAEIAFYLVEVF
ncbi:DUF1874 domain-containing protein, partial [Verrucomicrobiales bacterium BCK34]|nr:DUF1874 domain-containing protein [Verrucomicrobiales bacterium BCK34]